MARSSVHRSSIIDLHKRGKTNTEIRLALGINKMTVWRAIKRWQETGDDQDRSRSGRPRTSITPERVKVVRERIRRNPHRSMRKMSEEVHTSVRSLRRIVRNVLKMKAYRVRKVAILSERNKLARLRKCKALLSGTRRGTHLTTVFTDEKLFNLEAEFNPQNHRVYASGPQEANSNGRLIHRAAHPQQIMVFGGITSNGKTPLVFVEPGVKVNQDYYLNEILKKVMLPWSQSHFGTQNWTFQQDGAPAHTAKRVQQWCEANFPNFIRGKEWPASSPDLNPMDYSVWGTLQAKVQARPHKNLEDLKKSLLTEWDNLSPDYLRATIDAYPKRLMEVIENEGARIEQL
ncbi:unnamed protein product [Caenorhabditis nigoni]